MNKITLPFLTLLLLLIASVPASAANVVKGGSVSPRVRESMDLGPVPKSERHRVVVGLALRNRAGLDAFLRDVQDPASPRYQRFLTQEEFNALYAPTPDEEGAVVAFLERSGLRITDRFSNRLVVGAAGDAGAIERAFGVRLHAVLYKGARHYAPLREPSVPAEIAPSIEGVVGLDDFHAMHAHIRRGEAAKPRASVGSNCCRLGPSDLKVFYDNDFGFDGTGETVIVAGAFAWSDSDVRAFNAQWGLPPLAPGSGQVCAGPAGSPGCLFNRNMSDEASLDVQYAHGTAPGAVVLNYMSASTADADFVTLYNRVVSDNRGHVVSTSWGGCEVGSSPSLQHTDDSIFANANAVGQSWFAASGDSGSRDCNGVTNVDHPANSPHVIGVGGTTPACSGGLSASNPACMGYSSETGWSGSGGGASQMFSRPSFQKGCGVPAGTDRLVPDVALESDPTPGNYFIVNGRWASVGGTSIAAPQWAGFWAELDQQAGGTGLGNPGPTLYGLCGTSAFHDITSGSNGDFSAASGYDLVTGLGTIDARLLISPQSAPPPPPSPTPGLVIRTAKIVGDPASLVAGCPRRKTLVAVAEDGLGTLSRVGGTISLDGVPTARVSLRAVATPPPGSAPLPPGQVYSALMKFRPGVPGMLEINLIATDKARNVSDPLTLSLPVVSNAPPVIGPISISGPPFTAGAVGVLHVESPLADDCAVRSAVVEIDFADGRGFRRAVAMTDKGRGGDATGGDGVWTANTSMRFSAPGTYAARVTAQDVLKIVTHSSPFMLDVQ
jgi:kumamolisin